MSFAHTFQPLAGRTQLPGLDTLDDMFDSLGDPSELTGQQQLQLRTLFESEDGLGLYLFAQIICGCKELYPNLHLEFCEFLSKWGQLELADGTTVKRSIVPGDNITNSWRRLMLCVPRDTFKTTLGTRVNALWTITKDPTRTVGIFNESEEKAKQWVAAIQSVVENNKLYQTLWPERLPPGIHYREADKLGRRGVPRGWAWGSTGLLFNREQSVVSELSIKAFGIGGSHAGYHFTHLIKDDIIGEKAAQSEAIMQDAVHWVDHARDIERPAHNGCELVNFTRWGHADVYAHMLRKWPEDYQVYHRSQLETPTGEPNISKGESIFPARMSTQQARREWERDPFTFSSQRMCLPMAGRDTSFQPTWIKRGEAKFIGIDGVEPMFDIRPGDFNPDWRHPDHPTDDHNSEAPRRQLMLSWINKGIILDPVPPPNSGEKKQEPRSRNGIVVVGIDAWGRWYVFESVANREDPVAVLEVVLELADRWKTDLVGIESVCFSAVYGPLWSEIMRGRRKKPLQFCPLFTEGVHKDMRIKSTAGPHREGMVFYNDPCTLEIQQELIEYPYGDTRDLIDALAYLPKLLSRPQTIYETNMGFLRRKRQDSQRSQMTGY